MTERIVFVGIIAAGLVGFILALRTWAKSKHSIEVPAWRRMFFSLGFLAVAGQVVLFALSWTHIGEIALRITGRPEAACAGF